MTYQPSHKEQAAENGDGPIAEVKAKHADAAVRRTQAAAVDPGEVVMANKIVRTAASTASPVAPQVGAAKLCQAFENRKLTTIPMAPETCCSRAAGARLKFTARWNCCVCWAGFLIALYALRRGYEQYSDFEN
jgi:hypothetical protein